MNKTKSKIKHSRITADLDTKNKNKIIFSIAESLRIIPNILSLELYPSSNKGYHLIIWSSKNISQKKRFKIREKIGDDIHRINIDKSRKFGRDTLFNKKWKL